MTDERMTIELFPQGAVAEPGTSLELYTTWIGLLLETQRDVLWQIGDLSLAVERDYSEEFYQAYPVKVSPDLIARCKGVAAAYHPDERNIDATWTIHAQNAKKPDRVALVQAHVDAGHTSDEARRTPVTVPEVVTELAPAVEAEQVAVPEQVDSNRWLLAIDISYYVVSVFPKAGVETAVEVCGWLQRLIEHLTETRNLTDVVVCFDGPNNHRKALTADWETPYKSKRTEKDPELVKQLAAMPDRLKEINLPCVRIDGMEADDVLASYAAQFPGMVTLMTADKDLRQCLVDKKCNILRDATWETNPETGQLMRVFDWVNVKKHMEAGCPYNGAAVSGITPELWPHFQAIAGDPTDTIKGCAGIGGVIAMKLIQAHGTVQNIIAAAKAGTAECTKAKMVSILEFEEFAETTLLLTTMRRDLQVPMITKLAMRTKP